MINVAIQFPARSQFPELSGKEVIVSGWSKPLLGRLFDLHVVQSSWGTDRAVCVPTGVPSDLEGFVSSLEARAPNL